MKLTRSVYEKILACPTAQPETGGILGEVNTMICAVCLDPTPQSLTRAEYCPDVAYLNAVISGWEKAGICFSGIFHTHLPGQIRLSGADKSYIQEIFRALPNTIEQLYFPIVLPSVAVFAYKAYRVQENITICEDKLQIIEKEN